MSYKSICKKYGAQEHFKGGQTLKNLPVSPKDKDIITKKSSVINWFKCNKIECENKYIGQSSRTSGDRHKKYLKVPSPINEHQNTFGYKTFVNFKIISMEGHRLRP